MDVHPINIHTQVETYEHLGDVTTHCMNLDDRYKELTSERRVFLSPDDADVVVTASFPVSPPELWVWLNDPGQRTRWSIGSDWHSDERPNGRTDRGSRNHCANSDVVELILDWRPFKYFTVDLLKPPMNVTSTTMLEAIPEGTRVTCTFRFNGRLPRWACRILCKLAVGRGMKMKQSLEILGRLLGEKERV